MHDTDEFSSLLKQTGLNLFENFVVIYLATFAEKEGSNYLKNLPLTIKSLTYYFFCNLKENLFNH